MKSSSFREGCGFLGIVSDDDPTKKARARERRGRFNPASGRGSVKQRPNPLDSEAGAAVLRHIVLSQYAGLPPKFSGRPVGEGARAWALLLSRRP